MSSGKCKLKQWDTATLLLEWPKSRTLTPPNAEGCEATGTLIRFWWECKMFSHLGGFLHILLPRSLAIPSIYPKELKTCVHIKTCTWMFIATSHIIAKIWKQPQYPSVGEWINKLWSVQTMGFHSAVKRSQLSSHEKTGRNPKCTLLSERNQSGKTTDCTISAIWYSAKDKTMETS